jgi:hypothetical protein
MVCVALVVIVVAGAPAGAAAQPSSDALPPTTIALVESWPDGRVNYELTSARRAVMWTPRFPREQGFTPPAGQLPVFAVQLARVLVGADIKVDVSVLLGSAEPPGVPVATVVVSPGSRIVVDELKRFGVQPLALSLARVAPLTPYLPTMVSASPRLEIARVDILTAPYPGYRVTLRNLGEQGVATVDVQSYRGTEKALSAVRRSEDGRPLIAVGGSYSFDLTITSGASGDAFPGMWSPRPLDLIDIEAVRWADGSVEGTPLLGAGVEALSGRRLQLQRIVAALRRVRDRSGTAPDLLAALAAAISSLPQSEPEQLPAARAAMEETRRVLLSDVARFEQSGVGQSNAAVIDWFAALTRRYEAWLTRVSPP